MVLSLIHIYHTGSHKINNVLGQVLLAKKMGKTRVIAETGAGQHGVATATAAALMDMECEIFMGKEDTDRQALNVFRMELLGAKVHAVTSGTMTLKDAVNETLREWASRMDDTLYVLGSVMGPHPFPTIVRDFQKIIGKEIKEQLQACLLYTSCYQRHPGSRHLHGVEGIRAHLKYNGSCVSPDGLLPDLKNDHSGA